MRRTRLLLFVAVLLCAVPAWPATLEVGDPAPSMAPGRVSRVSVSASDVVPVAAGFDLEVAVSATGGVPVRVVNDGTTPPGLVPGETGWVYDEGGITVFLPLAPQPPGVNESALASGFLGGQGDDGILLLRNEATGAGTARVAFAYQSPRDTPGLAGGGLFDVYVYVGLEVPDATVVEVSVGGTRPLLAAFGGVPLSVTGITPASTRLYALGDVNTDTAVDLMDAILILKVLAGMDAGTVDVADLDRDGALGPPELVFVLHKVAEIR
ncbi:MAG: hypothetical protein ACLFOY_02320 [Desulfatibacillaceae bacterium]